MDAKLNPDVAADKARQLLDAQVTNRVEAIRSLARSAAAAEAAREAADTAEREFASAYRDALQAGWSDAELRSVGVPTPKRRAPGRPRKNRPVAGDAGSAPQGQPGPAQD